MDHAWMFDDVCMDVCIPWLGRFQWLQCTNHSCIKDFKRLYKYIYISYTHHIHSSWVNGLIERERERWEVYRWHIFRNCQVIPGLPLHILQGPECPNPPIPSFGNLRSHHHHLEAGELFPALMSGSVKKILVGFSNWLRTRILVSMVIYHMYIIMCIYIYVCVCLYIVIVIYIYYICYPMIMLYLWISHAIPFIAGS